MSGLLIRALEPADAAGVTELINLPGVRRGTARLPFTSRAAVEARVASPGAHDLVAVRDGRVVGQAFLAAQSGRRAHVGHTGIRVHDDHVGTGVGTALMTAVLELADRWLGLRRVELTVNADNAPAIALYAKLGFEREGTKRGDILRDGELIDCHLMARLREAPPLRR